MAVVQSYTKTGIDNKLSTRAPYTLVHNGGGTPDISVYPDAVTGDVIERAGDGARWDVIARSLIPAQGRVVSIAGKTGIVTLTPSDVGAAPATHTHTKAQISDLNASTSATSNSMAQRDSGGRLTVSNPTQNAHAATKSYVDTQITSGTTWANLSGKPSTFPPSTHTHTRAQISDLNATTTAASNSIALRDANGRLTVSDPTSDAHAANRRFVELSISGNSAWGNLGGKPSTFPPSTHTHPKSQITGLTTETANATANTLALRDSGGRLSVGAPTSGGNATTKTYVDAQVTAGKAWANLTGKPSTFKPSTHTHTKAQVTGLTTEAVAATANTLALRGQNGTLIVADPTVDSEAATKSYVDSTVTSGTTWANLSGKPSTFPPSTHTHTKSQISNLNDSATATANSIALRDSGGRLVVATPTGTTHATTKAYVDSAVSSSSAWSAITGKPSTFTPSTHTHTYSQITDSPKFDMGYNVVDAETEPTEFPTGVSYAMSNAVSNGWNEALRSDYPDASVPSFWMILTARQGGYAGSTVQQLYSYNRFGIPVYMRTWDQGTDTWGPFMAFTDDGHKHRSSDVSDSTDVLHPNYPSRLLRTRVDGQLYIYTDTITSNNHAANKQYVDQRVNTRAATSHTHTSANITDAVTNASGATSNGNKLLKTDSSGRVTAANPTSNNHVANKSYVDTQISSKNTWANLTGKPSTFAPSTHTHTSAQISNAVTNVSGSSTDSGKVLKLTSLGRLTATTPSGTTDVANKAYVDAQVTAGKAWTAITGKPSSFPPSSHTHSKAQITGLTTESSNANANTLALRSSTGRIDVGEPVSGPNATTKTYVDTIVNRRPAFYHGTTVPTALPTGAVSGDKFLHTPTMTIYYFI